MKRITMAIVVLACWLSTPVAADEVDDLARTPQALVAFTSESGTFLSWQPPINGSAVLEYRVYRAEFGEPAAQLGSTTNTTFTDSVPLASTPQLYEYRVTAVDALGESDASNAAYSFIWSNGPAECILITFPEPPFVGVDEKCTQALNRYLTGPSPCGAVRFESRLGGC